MISIVIPTHNEEVDVIRPLMKSLDDQVGIDFEKDIEILICSDVDHGNFDEYDFDEYKFIKNRIRKIKSPIKNNIGMNRQAGINNALGEYVFFCDIDDSLFHYGVLRELRDNIEQTHADVYSCDFVEEVISPNNNQYILHKFNWIWVFSKAYKVEFLKKNKIEFNPTLKYHEDTYFNFLVKNCDPDTRSLEEHPCYLWRARENSITRKDSHDYSFSSWDEYIDAVSKAIKHVSVIFNKDCKSEVLALAVNTYDTLNNKRSELYRGTEKYEKVERAYYNFIKEFMPIAISGKPMPKLLDNITTLFYERKHDFFPDCSWYRHVQILKEKYGQTLDNEKQ